MGGDVLEATATVTRVGRRSRGVPFEARVVCRPTPEVSASAAAVLAEPIVVTTATGTVVVPGLRRALPNSLTPAGQQEHHPPRERWCRRACLGRSA